MSYGHFAESLKSLGLLPGMAYAIAQDMSNIKARLVASYAASDITMTVIGTLIAACVAAPFIIATMV
jgi:hypothetical protein